MIELLWLVSERDCLTFEAVQEYFSANKLKPDDITAVCRILEQSGVNLIEASAVRSVQPTGRSLANESVQRKLQHDATQNYLREIGGEQPAQPQVEAAPLLRMEAADHEMRQILYGFGFAAHQHVVWAKKLIACPSAESLEHMLAGSEIRNRRQFFKALPQLVKQVLAVNQKAAAAYREWRQTKDQINGDDQQAEFGKLNHMLAQMLPQFCYRVTVIQQMIAIAQSIAGQFRASQHVHEQIQQGRNSVCRLPLADVELQAIETMEDFVRMPCERFLRNCTQLQSAAAAFHQARCQLVHDHLPLVATIAATYRHESLPVSRLIRAGIFGLLSAVEQYGYRYSWRFSAYASCWIRRSMREALAAQPRKEEGTAEMVVAS